MKDQTAQSASRPTTHIILAPLALLVVGVSVSAAAAADGAEFLTRVKTLYGESRKTIRTVEYDFTNDANGNLRQGRYARDGERVYLAGVDIVPGGLSMPNEMAWDGQRVHDRVFVNRLNRSTNKTQFKPTTSVPETYLNMYLAQALGFEPRADQRYHFVGARTVDDRKHGSCVQLEFAAEWFGGTFTSTHAREFNYAPVRWRLVGKDGTVATELIDVRYAKVESDGNELFYPVSLTILASGGADHGGNTLVWRVDEATLKVNQPIPRSRFVLEPWPSEDVFNWDTKKMVRGKDPNWSPVGKVNFPWDDFVRLSAGAKERVAAASGATPIPAAARRPWPEAAGAWLAVPGLAVLATGGYIIYRQRHPRRRIRA